jgi:hypothetical protein
MRLRRVSSKWTSVHGTQPTRVPIVARPVHDGPTDVEMADTLLLLRRYVRAKLHESVDARGCDVGTHNDCLESQLRGLLGMKAGLGPQPAPMQELGGIETAQGTVSPRLSRVAHRRQHLWLQSHHE